MPYVFHDLEFFTSSTKETEQYVRVSKIADMVLVFTNRSKTNDDKSIVVTMIDCWEKCSITFVLKNQEEAEKFRIGFDECADEDNENTQFYRQIVEQQRPSASFFVP